MYRMHYFYSDYACYLSRLRWRVLLQYLKGVSAIHMEKNFTISRKVVDSCFQSSIVAHLPYYSLLIIVC